MPKRYDQAYFDRWYRDPAHSVGSRADLVRQVTFAVAVTEQLLCRPIRSVLDAGAGEGRWQPLLHRLRPHARYAGVDSSAWAVARYGRRRNLRLGSIETLDELGLDGPFDLVVAADVLHYLPTPVLRRALAAMVPLIGGVAFLPTFTRDDASEGDHHGFQPRRASTYRRLFAEAGLIAIGMHAWMPAARAGELAALERAVDA
ncbi:MAG: class I SAM-dependent methyltransferase [Gemmatimonadetes bacterium]|nr:class I SAM-dependent methyltransferase [Gemmatimonadota bacterium]MBK9549044.1 class I SAM-dependent methyltransferase [Gemmatimonadota bacterium]MBP6570989.1 class I SAM-dependent methyltransferase [Gemmatimonadales bacterium]